MDGTTLVARHGRLWGTTARGRRRRVMFGLLAVVAIAAAFPALASAKAPESQTPVKGIWDYAVFGWDSVNVKGQGLTTINGNVGVNNKGGTASICSNGTLKMAAHTQLVADNLVLSPLCQLWDVFYGTKPKNLASIPHNGDAQFTPPINPTDVPPFPVNGVDCDKSGTKDFTVNTPGDTPTPKPGTAGVYGKLTLKDYASVHLGSGVYIFCSVSMGQHSWFDYQPDTTVIVTQTFSAGNYSGVGHTPGGMLDGFKGATPTNDAWIYVRGDNPRVPVPCDFHDESKNILNGGCVTTPVVNLAKHATVHGTFFARFGALDLGHDSDLFGHFWAKTITSDANVRVTGPQPSPPTTTTTTIEVTTSTQPG